MSAMRLDSLRRAVGFGLLTLALAFTVAGCASDEGFPSRVPEHGHNPWADPPLTEAVNAELSETRQTLVAFLETRRRLACTVDEGVSARRARQRARDRVHHAYGRAAVIAEKKSMSFDVELNQVLPYEDTPSARHNRSGAMLGWQCDPPPEDACLMASAHAGVAIIKVRYLRGRRVSQAAVADFLPVLRRDLQWGLPKIEQATSRQAATEIIRRGCRRGESPLGNWTRENVGADHDHTASMASRLGGQRSCDNVARMYGTMLAAIQGFMRSVEHGQACKVASQLAWPE